MTLPAFLSDNKTGVFLTILVLLLGTFGYFTLNNSGSAMSGANVPPDMFEGLHLKVLWTDSGEPELIAHARNNAMVRYAASDGKSIPESGTMVLGAMEGGAMKKEGEYAKIGDKIEDFGLNLSLSGVLAPTGTIADRFHFLDTEQFNQTSPKSDIAYVQLTSTNMPKLFYTLPVRDPMLANLSLAEGKILDYSVQNLAGDQYYPLIVGSDEAKVMRDEKLFSKPGDTIHNFFGRNVYLVGVLKPTGNALDEMHFTPLGPNDWKNGSVLN
jgi:hypothetical protein